MILEKDKEGQSKCFLSYSKPNVLKWAICDKHALDWASIPKFRTLDDIVAPVRLLELFLDDVLVDMNFGNTKLYMHREKADISFEITNEKICLFLKHAAA